MLHAPYAQQVIRAIEAGEVNDARSLNQLKLSLGRTYHLQQLPSNQDILACVETPTPSIIRLLATKPVRTVSGVAPVAIMTRPSACAHGKCIMCPGGIGSPFGDVPQSYTGNEPATMRGIANGYDPYLQVFNRLWQYVAAGHNPGKVELIVMGGTFPSMEVEYQADFVTYALKAMNDFSDLFYRNGAVDFPSFHTFFDSGNGQVFPDKNAMLRETKGSSTLEKEQHRNEIAWVKNVATCIETKPDWCMEKEIAHMLKLGATRIELGVQCLDDTTLSFLNRGHTLQESVDATRKLKDSALKVMYHMMPGLPFTTPEKDVAMFRELFENPDYRPDALKIYPCMVMPGTALHKLWERGKYTPYTTQEAAEVIAQAKRYFPKWVRVHRVQRDIPTKYSRGGIDKNNLRQLVEKEQQERGIACACIRCREAGILQLKNSTSRRGGKIRWFTEEYNASGGREFFLSAEDAGQRHLFGFCRLRIPGTPFRKELGKDTGLIRELHVVGNAMGIGVREAGQHQHQGIGKKLLQRAEHLSRQEGCKEVSVISGIGAREYYFRLGYERNGAYVTKRV